MAAHCSVDTPGSGCALCRLTAWAAAAYQSEMKVSEVTADSARPTDSVGPGSEVTAAACSVSSSWISAPFAEATDIRPQSPAVTTGKPRL